MLSYIMLDMSFALNLFCALTIFMQYKRKRSTLPICFLVCAVFYLIVDLICATTFLGLNLRLSFILAGYFEIFGVFGIVCLFTSGNVWRNYVWSILHFMFLNMLVSFIISLDSNMETVYSGYLINMPVPLKEAVIMYFIISFCGLISALLISKFLKKEYQGNGKIYMIFSLAYTFIGIIQLDYKQGAVEEAFEQGDVNQVSNIVFAVTAVCVFYAFGIVYYHFEKKRLAQENLKIQEYINDNYARYEQLVDENSKLNNVKKEFDKYNEILDKNEDYDKKVNSLVNQIDGIALTGNVVLDAIIKNGYDEAKKQDVTYEFIPGNVTYGENIIISCATIIDSVLKVALDFAKEAKKKWVYLSLRQNEGMIIIKCDFSKNKEKKLGVNNNIFSKVTENERELKIIKSLAEEKQGTIDIQNKDFEGNIDILLNTL